VIEVESGETEHERDETKHNERRPTVKKSEYVEARRIYWAEQDSPGGTHPSYRAQQQIQIDRDVAAAEAAGVVWDAEAPTLPVRLTYDADRAVVEDDENIVVDLSLDRGRGKVREEFTQRDEPVVVAMVDAYNAWGPQGAARAALHRLLYEYDFRGESLPSHGRVAHVLREVLHGAETKR
jgi:hypothetical protein